MLPTHFVKLIPLPPDSFPAPMDYHFATNFFIPAKKTSESRFEYRVCNPNPNHHFGDGFGIHSSDIEHVYTYDEACSLFPELLI